MIRDVLLDRQPSKQFATVEQIGGCVVFLCSPAAEQITGTTISVDGGWTAALTARPRKAQPRAAGRRRARRLHLGRARPPARRRRLEIDGLSGTSAGAMNAAVLASGLG